MPPFDQSHVDGYGVRVTDVALATAQTPACLRWVGTVRAGDAPPSRLQPGTAIKIFTGAPVPAGTEAIVMQEHCRQKRDRVWIQVAAKKNDHIRRKGEEYRRHQKVLAAGTRLTPPVISLLASLGCAHVNAHALPRVTLLITGNELVPPGRKLHPGHVYEANSHALVAAIKQMGWDRVSVRQVQDDVTLLHHALGKALRNSDVIITVGGVSVGEFDLVKDAAKIVGIKRVFWRVAVKPGMPVYFGTWSKNRGQGQATKANRRSVLCFGLPGNPVSALVTFHQFVRPALLRSAGQRNPSHWHMPVRLGQHLHKKSGRLEWVRGIVQFQGSELIAFPTQGQQSHMLGGLAAANSLLEFPAAYTVLPRGARVLAEWLSWA
jgi:molybdopterin molybdotransferase